MTLSKTFIMQKDESVNLFEVFQKSVILEKAVLKGGFKVDHMCCNPDTRL